MHSCCVKKAGNCNAFLQEALTDDTTLDATHSSSINQSMEFAVRVGEPDVTHWTSWPENTGECSGRPKVFGQHCAAKRGECYLGRDQTR